MVKKVNGKLEILKLEKIPSKSALFHSIVYIIFPISFRTFQHDLKLSSFTLTRKTTFEPISFQLKFQTTWSIKRTRPKIVLAFIVPDSYSWARLSMSFQHQNRKLKSVRLFGALFGRSFQQSVHQEEQK